MIIPEDPRNDQYVLKPIVERIFRSLQIAARVEVLQDPSLRGVSEALNPEVVSEIIRDNQMEDLFLLIVDRDCDRGGNEAKAKARESESCGKLIACLAVEEVEVWMLALHRGLLGQPWAEVREDCDPKERFAEPFLSERGWGTEVGRGRKRAMRSLGQGWSGLLSVCPEVADLSQRIADWTRSA